MPSNRTMARFLGGEGLLLFVPAFAKLLFHLVTVNGYGMHGDELYYLACSDHLDWGYVDHPAFSILLLHIQRFVLGDSPLAIRLIPAIAGSFTVFLAGVLARRMGAGVFGQLLSGTCALVAPAYLALNHFYSMNALDLLFWLLAEYFVLGIIQGNPKEWLWLGIAVGLGFENKIGVLFLGFGIAAGLVLTKQRRLLFSRWLLIGGSAALLLALPHILWQVAHGWPTLEWIANARSQKMVALPPLSFIKEQIVLMQPLTILVWATGLAGFLVHPALSKFRTFGWCYLSVLGTFIIQGAKPYYLVPIYPALFAAGSIVLEGWIQRTPLRMAVLATLLVGGALTAPLAMPVLAPEKFVEYEETIGQRPNLGERWAEGRMPAFFANFFGWRELTYLADSVYQSLPDEEKKACGILCQNYMLAGAIDFYGARKGLPHAISGHNNYWLWGTRGYSGSVMIAVGGSAQYLRIYFDEVSEKARFRNANVQPMLNDLPIFLVRNPKRPLDSVWHEMKSYI